MIAEAHIIQQKLMLEQSLAWVKQQRRAKREAANKEGAERLSASTEGTLGAGMDNFEQQLQQQQLETPDVAGTSAEKTTDDADHMED